MDTPVEHEMCGNCKKEIPQHNYVMHTAHCARNITLCQTCKEPIPKNQFEDHRKSCRKIDTPLNIPEIVRTNLEKSDYYQSRKIVEDKKVAARKEKYLERHEKFLDSGYSLNSGYSQNSGYSLNSEAKTRSSRERRLSNEASALPPKSYDLPARAYSSKSHEVASRSHEKANEVTSKAHDVTSKAHNVTSKAPNVTSKAQDVTPKTHDVMAKSHNVSKPLHEIPPKSYVPPKTSSGLLACKYCELELPKLDLEEHENYCGSRTDKCLECGEIVMFKYKQIHMDSNHGFLKLKDEPGPRASWESTTERSQSSESRRNRPPPLRPFTAFDSFDPTDYLPMSYGARRPPGGTGIKTEKGESYKEISRRLDCKTEYIRNLLHDSASITVPLRHNGAIPRNHFNHNKGPAPKPPRRRNPPTELVIPCEFCDTPIPHEDLIQHETGCRPDLARVRRSPEPDDYFIAPQPSSPEAELPCEFCADLIPASQLLRHQATCS